MYDKTAPKIKIFILSETKNLFLSFQVEKSKKRSFGLTSSGWHGKVNLQKFWNSLNFIGGYNCLKKTYKSRIKCPS
jgi:hypothetical protein